MDIAKNFVSNIFNKALDIIESYYDNEDSARIIKYNNGDIYEGQFEKGFRDGFGKMNYKNGDIYIGRWTLGKPHGYGKMYYNNGYVYEGTWILGVRYGYVSQEYKNLQDVPNDLWNLDKLNENSNRNNINEDIKQNLQSDRINNIINDLVESVTGSELNGSELKSSLVVYDTICIVCNNKIYEDIVVCKDCMPKIDGMTDSNISKNDEQDLISLEN